MNTSWNLAATIVLIWLTAGPADATVVIDDFRTGPAKVALPASPQGEQAALLNQTGAMAGGHRTWTALLRGPELLGGSVDISPQGFTLQTDAGVYHRIDWLYGDTHDGRPPMRLDLSAADTLRFSFDAVPLGLNFNVLTYFRGEVDNLAQVGRNLLPTPGPVDLDFPFADIASRIADPGRPADFSQVSAIYIVTQSGGFVGTGGEGFRMSGISAVSAVPEPGTWILAVAGTLVVARRLRPGRSLHRDSRPSRGAGAGPTA